MAAGRPASAQESPWVADYPLNDRRLAWMLKLFDMRSRTVRVGTGRSEGYVRSQREAVASRYLEYLP